MDSTMKELEFDQLSEVSGGWSWGEMGATVIAGCVTGGLAAAVPTAGPGFFVGCVGGGSLAGIGYTVYNLLN